MEENIESYFWDLEEVSEELEKELEEEVAGRIIDILPRRVRVAFREA